MAARAWPGIAAAAIALVAFLVVLAVDDRRTESPIVEVTPEPRADVTSEAATAVGQTVYAAHCSVCHGAGLEGGAAGPSLSRAGLHHRLPTALDLFEFIKERMPVGGVGPRGLSDVDYLAVTSFVLSERGVRGADALTVANAAGISLAPAALPVPTGYPLTVTATPPPPPALAATDNTPPQAPTILEPAPALLLQGLSPYVIQMQTSGFVDADPEDQHSATEFEIRQIHEGVRVWGVTVMAAPLDQATLELGNFEGRLAGRMGLAHDTAYAIRARHRDSSGDPVSEWSAWSAPTVTHTVPQDEATPRPMRLRDIQPHGLRWETPDGAPVALGAGNSLLITGSFSRLHEIVGISAVNNVRDFGPAERYESVFLKFSVGAAGLEIPASALSFLDGTGVRRTVWLPWMQLQPGGVLVGAPTTGGAFYFESEATPLGVAPASTTLFPPQPLLLPGSRGRAPAVPWRVPAGFRVELVAGGLTLPVQMAPVPSPADAPDAPVAYITELQGSVKALGKDGSVWTYATNVLNEQLDEPPSRPSGEAGTSGVAVDSTTGDVFVSTVYKRDGKLFNKIVRLESDDGGRTAARAVDVLRMDGEATDISHQIHGLIFGRDDRLYAAVGDGKVPERAQDDAVFGGKVLRLQRDGRAPADNPRFDPSAPDAPLSYQWAKGLRNVFAIVQRPEDGGIYVSENGQSIDRLLRLDAGGNYGRPYEEGGDGHGALRLFGPSSVAPVGMAFASGGVFPPERQGRLYMGAFGIPFMLGPVDRGKEIWEIQLDAGGAVTRAPTVFVKYVGDGFATITGVAYLADGLYFVDFFADHPPEDDPGASGARLWRVVPDVS